MFRADMGVSYGKWEFTDDATGTYRDVMAQMLLTVTH